MSQIYNICPSDKDFIRHINDFTPYLSTLNSLDIIPSIDCIVEYCNNNLELTANGNIDISCSQV